MHNQRNLLFLVGTAILILTALMVGVMDADRASAHNPDPPPPLDICLPVAPGTGNYNMIDGQPVEAPNSGNYNCIHSHPDPPPSSTPTATATTTPTATATATPTATATATPKATATATRRPQPPLQESIATATVTYEHQQPLITATSTPTTEQQPPTATATSTPTTEQQPPTATATSTLTSGQQQPTATATSTLTSGQQQPKAPTPTATATHKPRNTQPQRQSRQQPRQPQPAATPTPGQQQPQLLAHAQPPVAFVLLDCMNARTGPGLNYRVVTQLLEGTHVRIVGIDPTEDWYLVEVDGVEDQLWIYRALTRLVGSLDRVRRYTTEEIAQLPGADSVVPLAVTVPITMNVRTGPGLNYEVVRSVPKGTQGRIFGIDPNNEWFQIELEGLDTLVWVYQDLTTVVGSLAGVKWVTESEVALLPAAITQPLLLNARAGPGLTYEILRTVAQGTWMQITGIDTLGEWYRVELADVDQQAWIFRDYTKVAGGSLSELMQIALGGNLAPAGQLANSITVDLSLPPAGGVDLEVSWVDVNACSQFYNLYHRGSTDTTLYISLELAVAASTANSRSFRFSNLSGSSFISVWCGTNGTGRKVVEVEIDPAVPGTYRSTSPAIEGVAALPARSSSGP